MAAQKGNKTAEKWTKVTTLKLLSRILLDVKKDKIFYLGIALAQIDLYPQIWEHWQTKFKDDTDVIVAIKRVESQIEANLLQQSATNKINATIAIFVLKNKYKWSDKQEIDHTSKGESIVWQENKTYKNEDGRGDS